MKLSRLYLTKNACYKAGEKIAVKGLMLHSTGANNPKLSRYVGPDDGVLGVNPNGNHWNTFKPDGRSVCVHGFIGKDKHGEIRTYQTLPWNYLGWHSGGSANGTHIGIEICEGNLNDAEYFKAVYTEAVELFAFLCNEYKLTEKNIIDHSEGYKLRVASNHGDVMHWFSKHGKSMNTFRADVKRKLEIYSLGRPIKPSPPKEENTLDLSKTQREELAKVYKLARTSGIFSSSEHEKAVVAGAMTQSKAIYLNGLIAGALLNSNKRV